MSYPLVVLLLGLGTVIGLILVLRLNAFVALITAAMLVSLLAPGEPGKQMVRLAESFGTAAGKFAVVIALASIIGKCLMDSGAADRIVRSFLRALGEKRAPEALLGSGFVLAVPVFFDTVFYLVVPLARSLWRQTRKNYLLYILAIGVGGATTHTLVPPTPGPLAVAGTLGIDLGVMILGGILIGLPTAAVGMMMARLLNRLIVVPMRPYPGEAEVEPLADERLPGLGVSLVPILLPVVLIAGNTASKMLAQAQPAALAAWVDLDALAAVMAVLGDANLSLLVSAVVAMGLLVRQRGLTLAELGKATEDALMSGGVIILITAAGGAFGAMLAEAKVGDAVKEMFAVHSQTSGMVMLAMAFSVAALLKTAQGSSTVAMITTAGMISAMGLSTEMLGFNMVYVATAIAGGSLVCSWMNDSGFWVVARMSGMTETEALKTWTVTIAVLGCAVGAFSALAAWLVPLA